jgi:hypothetical protein
MVNSSKQKVVKNNNNERCDVSPKSTLGPIHVSVEFGGTYTIVLFWYLVTLASKQ